MFAKTFKSSSQVIRLFEELNKQEVYDDSSLSEKTGIKNLIPAKIALRKILFKAMRNYREDIDINQELRDDISNIDFLLRKGLKEEAAKEIRKAVKTAEQGEAYSSLSELISYSAMAVDKHMKADGISQYFQSLLLRNEETLALQKEVQQAVLYQQYLGFFMRHGNYESPHEFSNGIKAISSEIELRLSVAKSNYAKICLLTGLASAHTDEKCLEMYQQIDALFKEDPQNIEKHPNHYFIFLTNYLTLTAGKNEFGPIAKRLIHEMEIAIKTLTVFFTNYPGRLPYFKRRLLGNKLTYAKANSEWDEMDALVTEAKQNMTDQGYKKEVTSALVVASLISCLFDQKKYAECLDWISCYYTLPSAKTLKPLMLCVRFFEAIAFYFSGDYNLSGVKANNLVKTILEQDMHDEYHKTLCTLLRRLNHWGIPNTNTRIEISDIKVKFEVLANNNDSYYSMYKGFLEPDRVLASILD
ncbi:MAG: hypothetical protein JWO06_4110 [Bacteroidota bacterium]|nr:hypothetical protein [Bacteroidota bacterium]